MEENNLKNNTEEFSVDANSTDIKNEVNKEVNKELENNQAQKLTRKQEILNIVKFVLFSISAGVIQILSFALLSELIFHDSNNQYGLSYFISLVLSVLWNFTFNRKFTFKSAKNIPIAMLLVFAYYCAFTPLSIWWGVALTNQLGWDSYLVLFLTMVINMITEYLWTRFVVYKNNINTATKNQKVETTDLSINNEKQKEQN